MNISHPVSATLQTPKLRFYGGRILENPTFVSFYAGSYWNTSQGKEERATLTRCSRSIPAGAHASVWKEYGVNPGRFIGSAVLPLTKQAKIISERDIQSLVAQGIKSSPTFKPDGDTVFTVFLPPGVVLTHGSADSRKGLGGFHGSYVDPSTNKAVYYSAIVYADERNGVHFTSDPIENMTIAASHEWSEAVTDPDVNRGKLGWYDKTFGEIGDIPLTMGYQPSTMWGIVNRCPVQKEWSNARRAPVLK